VFRVWPCRHAGAAEIPHRPAFGLCGCCALAICRSPCGSCVGPTRRNELAAVNFASLAGNPLIGSAELRRPGSMSPAIAIDATSTLARSADHTTTLAGGTPILAMDMYEHAYQMDFGAKAANYVDVFMKVIRCDPRIQAALALRTGRGRQPLSTGAVTACPPPAASPGLARMGGPRQAPGDARPPLRRGRTRVPRTSGPVSAVLPGLGTCEERRPIHGLRARPPRRRSRRCRTRLPRRPP